MVKYLISLTILINLVSCATRSKTRSISKEELDGLRFESLSRYDTKRLKHSKVSQQPISLCHAGEYNKAYNIFKQQLDQQKDKPIYWNHIATCNLLEDKPSRAIFYYNIALSTAKDDKIKAIIQNNIGIYYLKLNNHYFAKQAFSKAISLNTSFMTPKYNLAQVYLKFSQFDQALEILNKLLNKAPEDIDFMYSMGHLHLMKGQYKKAISYFSKISDEYLTRDDIATNYAMSLFFSGRAKEAYKILKNARMDNAHYLFAQTELLKKIERIKQ